MTRPAMKNGTSPSTIFLQLSSIVRFDLILDPPIPNKLDQLKTFLDSISGVS